MNKVWTDREKDFIRHNAAIVHDKDLAYQLTLLTGRYISIGCLRKARARLGITKRNGPGVCRIKQLPKSGCSIGLTLSA